MQNLHIVWKRQESHWIRTGSVSREVLGVDNVMDWTNTAAGYVSQSETTTLPRTTTQLKAVTLLLIGGVWDVLVGVSVLVCMA